MTRKRSCLSDSENSQTFPERFKHTHSYGVSINGDIPKWMVYTMEIPIKMDDLGVPLFQETTTKIYRERERERER